MAKRIIVTDTGWVATYHRPSRPYLTKLVFSLAAECGWGVAMHGMRWRDESVTSLRPRHKPVEPLTGEQFAMLMGPYAA